MDDKVEVTLQNRESCANSSPVLAKLVSEHFTDHMVAEPQLAVRLGNKRKDTKTGALEAPDALHSVFRRSKRTLATQQRLDLWASLRILTTPHPILRSRTQMSSDTYIFGGAKERTGSFWALEVTQRAEMLLEMPCLTHVHVRWLRCPSGHYHHYRPS